ncbi:MAG: EamA family transporter [Acidimicrobiales bacterium]|nr:EamA family transporter [Acidimicrobiales bacterium]
MTVSPPDHHVAGTLAVTGAMVAFGVNNVIVRTTGLTGIVTASYRLFLGIALLVGVLALGGRRPSLRGLRVALAPGVCYGAAILLFFTAFKETSLANATLIAALQSGVSLTVVGRFFGEKVRAGELILTGVATGGVALVIFGGEAGGAGRIEGDLLAIAAMLANTAYFVLGKRARAAASDVDNGAFQVGLLTVAAAMTIPLVVIPGDIPVPDGGDWIRLLVLAVGGTLGHLGVNWAHRHVTLTTSSLLTLAVPVVSSTVAWFVLDEYLSVAQWVGASVTLASLTAVVLRAVRPARPLPATSV